MFVYFVLFFILLEKKRWVLATYVVLGSSVAIWGISVAIDDDDDGLFINRKWQQKKWQLIVPEDMGKDKGHGQSREAAT